MGENFNYFVFPRQPNYQTFSLSEEQRKYINGAPGIIEWPVAIVTFLLTFLIVSKLLEALGNNANTSQPVAVVVSIVTAIISSYLINRSFKKKNVLLAERKKSEEMYAAEVHRLRSTAENLTLDLTKTYNSSVELAAELPELLEEATSLLEEAEEEFGENAFAPFWDAVEEAAICLGDFNDAANEIAGNVHQYYQKLAAEQHTFPILPVSLQSIPDVSPVIERLHRVVRMGQTNFQFANIWEHRKTREVIIAGFRTLNEAIYNLGDTIDSSISDLQQSISSDVAKLVEEQIKTRDLLNKRALEQNQMLDNIQHHRKPNTDNVSANY